MILCLEKVNKVTTSDHIVLFLPDAQSNKFAHETQNLPLTNTKKEEHFSTDVTETIVNFLHFSEMLITTWSLNFFFGAMSRNKKLIMILTLFFLKNFYIKL